MEVYSSRKLQINQVQQLSDTKNGTWKKVIDCTSSTGFIHGNPRPHSAIKIEAYTNGRWEELIKRSSNMKDGKGIKVPENKKDHFEVGKGTVAQIEEKDIFNLRGQKRINLMKKQSQVFDSVRKHYTTFTLSEPEKQLWNQRYRSDYSKYHHSNYYCPQKSLATQELSNSISKNQIQQSKSEEEKQISCLKSTLPSSLQALLVSHKPEKCYQNIQVSKMKDQSGRKQQFASKSIDQTIIIKEKISHQLENQHQISQRIKEGNNQKHDSSQISQQIFSKPKEEKIMSMERCKPLIQRARSMTSFRELSQLIGSKSSNQVGRCLSPTDTRGRENDLGDFDRKKKKRMALPTSEMQRKFQEYKSKFDSVCFG